MNMETRPRFGSACVLAGGRGSRLGGLDKLRLEFGGQRLLARIADQLSSRFTDLIAVSQRPDALSGLGYAVVPDRFADAGPLAGLHAALLSSRSEWVYLVACDMPFFSPAWVDALELAIDDARGDAAPPVAAMARSGRFLEPFHAFYHVSLAGRIEESLGTGGASADGIAGEGARPKNGAGRSIQSFIAPFSIIPFDDHRGFEGGLPLFFNMNTRGDIEIAGTLDQETGFAR
jgi:molybdopterin-guanine dinucleotide biosynthesis protein A